MLSVRLPEELEKKLQILSEQKGTTKTELVTEALEKYLVDKEEELTPYELGADLFGQAGTGEADSSVNYKQKVGVKINEKHSKLNN